MVGRDLEAISHWVLMGVGQIAQVLYINKIRGRGPGPEVYVSKSIWSSTALRVCLIGCGCQ